MFFMRGNWFHNWFVICFVLKWLWYDFFNYFSAMALYHSVDVLVIFSLSSGLWVSSLMLDLILKFLCNVCFSVSMWMSFDLRKENVYWLIKWLGMEIKKVFIVFP